MSSLARSAEAACARLVRRLAASPREDEHCEFKVNNSNPTEIGEYISALANSAALDGLGRGYMVWGVRDDDHEIVGTNFRPRDTKMGNEELQNWLLHSLEPQVAFRFEECQVEGRSVVLLTVDAATHRPVQFKKTEWIRIGSYKKKLLDHPEETRRLWRAFESMNFESGIAATGVDPGDVMDLLDYKSYFELMNLAAPSSTEKVLEALAADGLVALSEVDDWNITNLGAILFARRLDRFPGLRRKAMRVVVYDGNTRQNTVRERVGEFGYATGFAGMVSYVNNRLPANEEVREALRRDVRVYPELAIRELVANAIIHQDFTVTGAGPMVEIFDNRLEVTNPGRPLVDTRRFVDHPPRSRNEALASLMRRMGVCEERGSGWDRIGFEVEFHQLPAPSIEEIADNLKVTLYGPRKLAQMDRDDKIRAVYLHACLRYVAYEHTTNTSIRKRFGLSDRSAAVASRLIGDAVSAGVIAPYDPGAAKKFMRYVPYWADPAS